MESLQCIVERITYQNQENNYTVLKVRAKGYRELVTVVGTAAAVNAGCILSIKGEWKTDSKYGRQFHIASYKETLPASIYGIQRYLGSGLIKGVGPVYAKKIVNQFGKDTIDIIENTPSRLIEVEGIGKKRVETIKKAWQEQKEIKNVMIFLQSALNKNTLSIQYGGKEFRLNDKVMQIKNNYDKEVFNGDMGTICKINLEDSEIMIDFEGRQIRYELSDLDEIVLSYAVTIHKSQGSEYPIVIMLFTMSHFIMLQRNLLYTGITRAKKLLILVGSKKAIDYAVTNNMVAQRNTYLRELLKIKFLERSTL